MAKYRIKLESFRRLSLIYDNNLRGSIQWQAQVVDELDQPIAVNADYSLGYAFGDTKEEALLRLRAKLVKHEEDKREIEELNIKMGEIVEVEI